MLSSQTHKGQPQPLCDSEAKAYTKSVDIDLKTNFDRIVAVFVLDFLYRFSKGGTKLGMSKIRVYLVLADYPEWSD